MRISAARTQAFNVLLGITLCVGAYACKKTEAINATIVPLKGDETLYFRGYVTDDAKELVSKIHDFSRSFSGIDTLNGKQVYLYSSNGKSTPFYIDKKGTIRELRTFNLGDRLLVYNIRTAEPVQIKYWETVFKKDKGVGTEWQVVVDTTVSALGAGAKPIQIRYHYSAKARNEGWQQTFIPKTYDYVRAVDVYWYDIETYIINVTAKDSLFVRRGTAHQYFDPDLGVIKYISDYKEKGQDTSYVSRHGTWELIKTEEKGPK